MEQNQQDYLTQSPYPSLPSLPNSTTALVLGILSIVICGVGLILGIIGIVLANKDITLYNNNPGVYNESSYNNCKTGRICSIVGICISALFVVGYTVYMIFIFSMIRELSNTLQ
ncbi:MAG: hypothetical protein GXC73_10895 [Chitinophagaceae bacterium]|nr:hypothetical protein [Chitinophagaceae bacterium]